MRLVIHQSNPETEPDSDKNIRKQGHGEQSGGVGKHRCYNSNPDHATKVSMTEVTTTIRLCFSSASSHAGSTPVYNFLVVTMR